MTETKADARVVVSKNGLYIVTGKVPLSTQTIVADAGASESWKRVEACLKQTNTPCADVANRKRSLFAMALTQELDLTAAKQPLANPISARPRKSTVRCCY